MDSTGMPPSPTSPSLETPPRSRKSSRSKSPSLSIEIPEPPPLLEPSQPSNTLLVTNLNDPKIFAQTTLARLRNIIDTSLDTAISTPQPQGSEPLSAHDLLHSLSPLPSLRRIVLTFTTTAAAFYVRSVLDGTTLGSGDRIRVFFGADTPLHGKDHLQAPRAQKQFFISPPPSPPAGWTMRDEDPPNKNVHANDLASALGKIGRRDSRGSDTQSEAEPLSERSSSVAPVTRPSVNTNFDVVRPRSDSRTIVYQPQDHGHSPDLPAIAVEDTTESPTSLSPTDLGTGGGKLLAHTSRPPVELMQTD